MGVCGGIVGGERGVTVGQRKGRRAELLFQVGQERYHRRLHIVLVLLAMALEIGLRIVQLKAEEESLEVTLPTAERAVHDTSLAVPLYRPPPHLRPKIAAPPPQPKP